METIIFKVGQSRIVPAGNLPGSLTVPVFSTCCDEMAQTKRLICNVCDRDQEAIRISSKTTNPIYFWNHGCSQAALEGGVDGAGDHQALGTDIETPEWFENELLGCQRGRTVRAGLDLEDELEQRQ